MTAKSIILYAAILFTVSAYTSASAGDETPLPLVTSGKVFGRVMADYSYADGTDTNFTANDTELRRARIGTQLNFKDGSKLKAELNTNDSGNVTLTDAYIQFDAGLDITKIKVGQFKTPNSLDESSSSRFMSILERSAFTDAFEFNRRLGVAISGKSNQHTYSLGIFAQNIHDEESFGGYAIAGRATFNPKTKLKNTTLHAGISFRYRSVDTDHSQLRYRQRPVIHTQGRIIGTDRIANSDVFVGFETAFMKEPFWAAGEFALTFTDCNFCSNSPTLSGGYLEAGVMLNGQRTLKSGKFDRPHINDSNFGAVSLALRFDSLDLKSKNINGGSHDSYILAADWWPRDFLRIGANGFITNTDLGNTASGLDPLFASAVSTGQPQETVRGFMLRAQIDFWSKF